MSILGQYMRKNTAVDTSLVGLGLAVLLSLSV